MHSKDFFKRVVGTFYSTQISILDLITKWLGFSLDKNIYYLLGLINNQSI